LIVPGVGYKFRFCKDREILRFGVWIDILPDSRITCWGFNKLKPFSPRWCCKNHFRSRRCDCSHFERENFGWKWNTGVVKERGESCCYSKFDTKQRVRGKDGPCKNLSLLLTKRHW
jgi:hypothetical protein